MQKYVNLVDLVKSFPTNIYLQKSASIQPRTSLSKFGGKFNSFFIRLLRPDPTGTERIWAGYRFRFGNYLANLEAEKALPEHLRSSHFVFKEAQLRSEVNNSL